MTIRLTFLILVLIFISCKQKGKYDLELVSYHWSMKPEFQNDTLIPYVKCILYAQISKNGECVLTRSRYLESDLHLKFVTKKEILNPVFKIFDSLNSDTVMVKKSILSMYDGPSLKLIGFNNKGISHAVSFNCSNRSNPDLLNFYNYIDSISKNSTTTDPFMKAKESRTKEIYDSQIKLVPRILKDIEVPEEEE